MSTNRLYVYTQKQVNLVRQSAKNPFGHNTIFHLAPKITTLWRNKVNQRHNHSVAFLHCAAGCASWRYCVVLCVKYVDEVQ